MSDLISRETMKDLIDITTWYHQNRNKDMVAGASDEETAWFKAKDVFLAIENVPTAQQEITEKQVKEYCEKRCLIVLSSDAFHRLKSGHPERCEDCRNFNKARLLIPQSQRKEGKWIYLNGLDAFECSVCGRQMVRNIFDYCPWCGAEMTKGEEDE